MKEVLSKGEHCKWLAKQLKNLMGGYVSFNEFGLNNPILSGVYINGGIRCGPYYSKKDVRFYIKYCRGEFLKIQIEFGCNHKESIISAMTELIKALASIKQEDTLIGLPLAIYKIEDILTCEYAFKNQEIIIESLRNNTMFDDGCIENLRFLRTCNNCMYGSYAFEVESGKETLYCTDGGCDTQTFENETCINHKFEDGESPNIRVLCKSICENK